jgi:hypothetical protein
VLKRFVDMVERESAAAAAARCGGNERWFMNEVLRTDACGFGWRRRHIESASGYFSRCAPNIETHGKA